MRWWPRCTPSKTPMVTTVRPASAGTPPVPSRQTCTEDRTSLACQGPRLRRLRRRRLPKRPMLSAHEDGECTRNLAAVLQKRNQCAVRAERGNRFAIHTGRRKLGPVRQRERLLGVKVAPCEGGRRDDVEGRQRERGFELGQRSGGTQIEGADSRAPQRCEMPADAKSGADIAGQRADVGPRG